MKERKRQLVLWLGATTLTLLAGLLFWNLPLTAVKMADGVRWYGYEEGVRKARESNRPILLHFYTDWCKWCKRMDEETFANLRIQDFLNRSFITIRINTESKERIRVEGRKVRTADLARRFGVRSFPTTVFLESDGSPIGPLPGYVDPDLFHKVLAYVHEKAYKKMSFDEFTRQRSESHGTSH